MQLDYQSLNKRKFQLFLFLLGLHVGCLIILFHFISRLRASRYLNKLTETARPTTTGFLKPAQQVADGQFSSRICLAYSWEASRFIWVKNVRNRRTHISRETKNYSPLRVHRSSKWRYRRLRIVIWFVHRAKTPNRGTKFIFWPQKKSGLHGQVTEQFDYPDTVGEAIQGQINSWA